MRGPRFPAPWSTRTGRCSAHRAHSSDNGDSYLDMWRKAVDRERKSQEFRRSTDNAAEGPRLGLAGGGGEVEDEDELERKTERFEKILKVPKEERDRIQRLQIIDRAAAAIAAARALLQESPPPAWPPAAVGSRSDGLDRPKVRDAASGVAPGQQGLQAGNSTLYQPETSRHGTPGPDFWSWSPPPDSESKPNDDVTSSMPVQKLSSFPNPSSSLMEKEHSVNFLAIPFESTLFESTHSAPLPPLQSLVEFEKVVQETASDMSTAAKESNLDVLFSTHAAEAAEVLNKSNKAASHGVNPDGSKWWRETGTEQRPDGVICKWTLTRGVSADRTVEWEDKFWEAADQLDYKELGSQKSGRDADGNVWHEYWKESMWQDLSSGLVHMEKTADKWGKNGKGDEWQEKWWEHHDASGQAEKWAHKWCCIDPNTPLEAGHAHVWHERWGEKFDGKGSAMKYTDKWAERTEGDGWSKWGDKWDEHFDSNGHGVKQGETWWEGQYGERWNRTWGEQHDGSGWVHKYGKSSSGEHWDTHAQEDTWYERYPHYGFEHCFENSVQLRAVRKPSETL
ncbi:hypothetical protein COCNU_scaffold006994G000020 [Cocos nucifera]|nr:hypothetical protein [Cocos nucifera]